MKPTKLFSLLSFIGAFLGVSFCFILVYLKQLPWLPYACMFGATAFAFLFLSFATKIISGSESYVLYRHLIFSMCSVALALFIAKAPVLAYLDVYVCGFGVFHVCGRIGCYKAGCCHGRPAEFGIVYKENYRTEGFPDYLINVRLFPVQLMEAAGIAMITGYSVILLFSENYQPGMVWSAYLVLYATLRFTLEFLRGDPDRPYFAMISEAQWTSVLLLIFISSGEMLDYWPFSEAHLIIAVVIISTAAVVSFIRKFHPAAFTANAHHLKEIGMIVLKTEKSLTPQAHSTSLGLRISISGNRKENYICSLSYAGKGKAATVVKQSFRQIRLMRFRNKKVEMKKGNNGVYHFLIGED